MAGEIFSASDPFFARLGQSGAAMEKAKAGLNAKKMAEIEESAKDFEAMFLSEMLAPMFDTVPTDTAFGGGQAEDTWKGLMIEQYGKQIVASGGIGLADAVKAKMIEMQEAAQMQTQGKTE